MNNALLHEYRFQRRHGGGWVGHNAEKCLRDARAYLTLQEAIDAEVASIEWECDEDADTSWMNARTLKDLQDGRREALGCVLKIHGAHEASLWSIIVNNNSDPYCHIIESELALEALEALQDALAEVEDVMDVAY